MPIATLGQFTHFKDFFTMDTRYRLIMFVRSASEVVGFFTSQQARDIYAELMVIARAFFSTVKLIALASYSIGLETRKHFDNWAEEYLQSLEPQTEIADSTFLLNESFEPIALLAPPAQDVEAVADEVEAEVQTVEDVQPEVDVQADEPAIAPVEAEAVAEVEQVEEVEPQPTVELVEAVVEEAQPVEEVVVAAPAKKAAAKTKKATAAKTTVKKSSRTTRKASTAIAAA